MAKKVKDDDIRMNCPDKATCYEHLHNQSCLRAYRKENKRAEGYKQALEKVKDIVNQAEQKLHCCCDITEMLVECETIVEEALKK